mmetsp:Transcript_420/g.523  ORF Transcript_420/g.523 Transcript_420/m.523 type:complete len:141 (+) Transcript_420:171-593(+)
MSSSSNLIKTFLSSESFAVVGASSNRSKYGNKCLRKYMEKGLKVVPVHPKEETVEGLKVQQLQDLENPEKIGVSVITPPAVTLNVIKEAHELGFKNIWLQPGAESPQVIAEASKLGQSIIYGGPCILVSLDRDEHRVGKM